MSVLYFLESLRAPWLDALMGLVTLLGGDMLFLIAALILYWCTDKSKGYYLLTVGFTGIAVNQFLKILCRVPRPWVRDARFTIVESARDGATGYSFPSGHTQAAAATFGCAARVSRRKGTKVVLLALFALVAISRMYLGVHTPLDVGVSAAIGLALVFGLYPLFQDVENKPARLYAILIIQLLLAAAFVLYTTFARFPADIDAQNLAESVKNAWTLLGAAAGMLLSVWLDRRFIRFDCTAALPVQVVKTLFGLCLTVLLRGLLKAPLALLLGGHPAAHALRYFITVLFAAAVWPLTFPWFKRLLEARSQGT